MEVFFLIIIALIALIAYLPRILLWWVKRQMKKHMEAAEEPQPTEPQEPAKKATIADDEGEYVPFEEVKR